MANRLIYETSPYLRQHAENPVDWHPWGSEALERAQSEDKPIFLSIGYSACHWCHVMENESFANAGTARIMNEFYINIKVDREERPDLDGIYMRAVQTMTGHGGWPLSVFLMPDGRPFYGGTYFPLQEHQGMPSFQQLLLALADTYKTRRADVLAVAEGLTTRLREGIPTQVTEETLIPNILQRAYDSLAVEFDSENGGFGTAPKFPQPMVLEFLLRHYQRTREPEALHMVEHTIESMARGGIYDQIGGGFHRYSTDPKWRVPHFEKMLYDNALLANLYVHAYQLTRRSEYRRIAEETLDYVLREMTSSEGGFYSSQDADSEGQEGKYFVWTPEQILNILGKDDARIFCRYFGVHDKSDFFGHAILCRPTDLETLAEELQMSTKSLVAKLNNCRRQVLSSRQNRVSPNRDGKIIMAWNAMMLNSFAEAGQTFNRLDYLHAAKNNASFLLGAMAQPDGRLLRIYTDGQAKVEAFLEDYALLIQGLLTLYQATFDIAWLKTARCLTDKMIESFWSEDEAIFYDTGSDHETLVVRPYDIFDNVTPCGGSTAVGVLLRLALFTGESHYSQPALAILQSLSGLMERHPLGLSNWLCNLDFHLGSPLEIAVVGSLNSVNAQQLLDAIFGSYIPNKIVMAMEGAGYYDVPLLRGKTMINGQPTAYVCHGYSCEAPTTDPQTLIIQLNGCS